MRRIVVIAAGMSGVRAATQLKRSMPEHEINVVVPGALSGKSSTGTASNDVPGPVQKRQMAGLPNLELLQTREVGVLEASNIMPDLEEHAVVVTSSRGKLSVRYTDLLIDVPAEVRIPRHLQKAQNIFPWPVHSFFADPEPCDAALAAAAKSRQPVAVVGNGVDALEAVLIACEADAPVVWFRTAEKELLTLDPHLVSLALRDLANPVQIIDLSGEVAPERLACTLSEDKTILEGIAAPGKEPVRVACCFWTTPLMGRHPILREEGFTLDGLGRVCLGPEAPKDIFLMGSGVEVAGAMLGNSGVVVPGYPALENAAATAFDAMDAITGKKPISLYVASNQQGVLGSATASGAGRYLRRSGLCAAEVAALGREAVSTTVGLQMDDEGGLLALSMTADRASRKILGVSVLGVNSCSDVADGLFNAAQGALAEGTPLAVLLRRFASGRTCRLLAICAGVLRHRLDSVIRGISPDEYLASKKAGADFFTLDLRSLPDWNAGHIPGAYNIPLIQLKKRLQDEVPRYTPIVLVSEDGRDASAVACKLAGLGATDLYVLDGGMILWPHELERA